MRCSFALMLLFPSLLLPAQTPPSPAPTSPDLHLIKRTEAEYPPIARSARVTGTVVFKLTVGPDGHVLHATLVNGPPMLVGAAHESVQEWIYEPLVVDGKPVESSTLASVTFGGSEPKPRPDAKVMDKFWPLERTCMGDVSSNATPTKQAEHCHEAAEAASAFDPNERYNLRRSAYVYSSTAFFHNHQNQEALAYANKAVDVTQQGHLDGADAAAAYGVRAQAEAVTGNLSAASQDLDRAEQNQQMAIDSLPSNAVEPYRHGATGMLKNLLTMHAQVLTAQGKTADAQAKATEAARL